jgi:NADH-quinone oxidoreductase subunit C
VRTVDPADWGDALTTAAADGYRYLDLLAGVDRIERIEVVARVLDPTRMLVLTLVTSVPATDPRLPSAVTSHPAAAWHEREAAEMLGLRFDGHPDPRPLLLREVRDRAPLRKSTALEERVTTPWPGAVKADPARRARRPQPPPGVRPEWLGAP